MVPWNDSFDRLVAFKEAFGNCNVPRPYTADAPLGNWVDYQRTIKAGNWRLDLRRAVIFSRLFIYK